MKGEIIEYRIIHSCDHENVVNRVSAGLEMGWQPWGALSVTYTGDMSSCQYSQAVVLYDSGYED